jgi:retron-type reverse transcriptase
LCSPSSSLSVVDLTFKRPIGTISQTALIRTWTDCYQWLRNTTNSQRSSETVSCQCIPRGCRTHHIPGLNPAAADLLKNYESLYCNDPFSEETISTGEELMREIAANRREKWCESVTNTDMTHNSKKAWSNLRKLTGEPPPPTNPGQVSANQVATQLLLNGKPTSRMPKSTPATANQQDCTDLSKPFTHHELEIAMKSLKNGKAAGIDDLTVEQIKHLGPKARNWLLELYNTCLSSLKIPKAWRKSKVIALLKPGKDPSEAKSYRPISLLCHSYKLLERLLLNRLVPIVEPQLIPEQAGFRPGKSCTSQTLKLTQHIEDGFELGMITGVVFVDLTAAYDTVNIQRLLSKVAGMTGDAGFINILRELLHNRRFQVHLQTEKSRWRSQKNGLPQGSVLAPMLFNIYTNDQPVLHKTHRFAYADDLALAAQSNNFEDTERSLSNALEGLARYYEMNCLKANPLKTQTCAFHLRNRDANRQLNVTWNDAAIEHCPYPRYLGVTLDRTLSFKNHCLKVRQKVGSRNSLLRKLTSTQWGASAHTLRTTGLALCYSAGEYACPVWHRSAHAGHVTSALNDTCRIITGCLKPTPLNKLYPLAGIAPPEARREVSCNVEKLKQEQDPRHPLHGHTLPPSRLKSRKSFMRCTAAIESPQSQKRLTHWQNTRAPPEDYVRPAEKLPAGHNQPWPIWKSLNRLRSQVGRSKENLLKWGAISISDAQCPCGTVLQTMEHMLSCPACPHTCSKQDLRDATDRAISVATFWSQTV